MALSGRGEDESDEADRALVGALLVVEFFGDVRALRKAYVKES